ncbi:P-loop containing nucleoside triphosphate hydrolase protein [Tribonema minus]|uniref:P-loop containing nucleoside triphosphate hydrolase protein n=1 Tax=Tribonema minus TaxID=303371 RepID=A0A835ZAC2_9STRA|nr:P-loop containing nucleoside triphosphate hydrolase protein [Tribonema minus]
MPTHTRIALASAPCSGGTAATAAVLSAEASRRGGLELLHASGSRMRVAFPDRSLVQYDSGKLQALAPLLRALKSGGHKCLIFTQMTRMLDVLERFLAMHGHTYVRLDGSTGVERRQRLMDRFNTDDRLFCFILSTRSGGLGINLTGADTVIFFDSDWNPAMDSQAQDRAHRIGQTRDVHIYRLVTRATVEENILKKAQQKRHLDHLVMTEGNFNADYMSSGGLRDVLGTPAAAGETAETAAAEGPAAPDGGADAAGPAMSAADIAQAMASLEDADDVAAGAALQREADAEAQEFDDEGGGGGGGGGGAEGEEGEGAPVKPGERGWMDMGVNDLVQ